MPNIKSAKKRVLVSKKKTAVNKSDKSAVKTALRKLNTLIDAGDVAAAKDCFKEVCSVLDKAVAKGVMHKNTAANKKSGFAVRINALNA